MFAISRRRLMKGSAAVMAGAAVASSAFAAADSSAQNALAIMAADPRFSYWVKVLRFAGLQDYAAGGDNFTAFVPTDAAFQKYPWVLRDVLKPRTRPFPETDVQVEFVRSHVILDLRPLSGFAGKKGSVTSIAGSPIMIDGTKTGSFTVTWQGVEDRQATAMFTDSPIVASNALIYPFDNVSF